MYGKHPWFDILENSKSWLQRQIYVILIKILFGVLTKQCSYISRVSRKYMFVMMSSVTLFKICKTHVSFVKTRLYI